MEDTSIILIITIGTTFLGLMLKYAFKSKCDDVRCLWGCIKVHRNIEQEDPDTSESIKV
jgi:hypothetical protein